MADETKPEEQIEETHRQMLERLDKEQKDDPSKILEDTNNAE